MLVSVYVIYLRKVIINVYKEVYRVNICILCKVFKIVFLQLN